MNRQQAAYMKALKRAKAVHEEQARREAEFIKASGYTNRDGTVPERLYRIEDGRAFDRLCEEFMDSPSDLNGRILEAEWALHKAEEGLIDLVLSFAPAEERRVLDRNRNRPRIRERLLGLAMRLDTRTTGSKG